MRLTWSRIGRLTAALAVASMVLASCGDREADVERFALERSEAVTFRASDGVKLSGRLFGSEDAVAGVVLSHMQPADQRSWWEEASRLADQGYQVVTFNFRGFCPGGNAGCSEGSKDVAAIWQDVQGAAEYLSRQGVRTIGLVGASMGGTASLVVAGQPGADIDAVVTLSAPASIDGLSVTPQILQSISAAKLFIAGNGDAGPARDAQMFSTSGIQPRRLEILPSNDHGTDMLTGNQSENTRTLVLAWLEQYLSPAGESASQG